MTSAADYNAAQIAAGRLTPAHLAELVRYWQAGHPPLAADGMAGPATIETVAAEVAARMPPPPHVGRFLACPLQVLPDGRRAVITSSFRPADRPNHDGCDWFYAWKPGDVPNFVGDHGAAGSALIPRWVIPVGVLAIAAAAGVVRIAGPSHTGWRVWIDHGNGLRSGYFHLLDVRVKVGQTVDTGAALGLVGDNPADDDGRHLHFEVSPVGTYSPLDPELYLVR